ncbi:MraY family glycosyltransferase [Kordiimonas pumila]|uniref:Uncharacterized protein n=1 Tax=Kordiimonas pumila TaxID=2161677 RepID=A0ABV7D6P3_9PROT|nr:hypothetical protein [Kordiimonas pumila]
MTVLAIALNARYFGELLGVMDDPDKEGHKIHKLPAPLVGALMLGVLSVFMLLNHYLFDASSRMVGVSVCTIMAAMLGLVDDKLQLSWQVCLVAIAACCAVGARLRLDGLVIPPFIEGFKSSAVYSGRLERSRASINAQAASMLVKK